MATMTEFSDEILAWADLQTPDRAASQAFYARLFDWELGEAYIGDGVDYAQSFIDGHMVAGFNAHAAEKVTLPAFWIPYLKHRDVDTAVARVLAQGGSLVTPATDIGEEGRLALINDPAGGALGLWQPRNHTAAKVFGRLNSPIWTEFQTPDVPLSGAFYNDVFDWTFTIDDEGYGWFTDDNGRSHGRSLAGLIPISPAWGEVPPSWLIYFLVEDLDGKIALAQELGARIAHGPFTAGALGRAVVLFDPQGGVFALLQRDDSATM